MVTVVIVASMIFQKGDQFFKKLHVSIYHISYTIHISEKVLERCDRGIRVKRLFTSN